MKNMDNLSFNLESDSLSKNSKECLVELQKMTNFFNTFINDQNYNKERLCYKIL